MVVACNVVIDFRNAQLLEVPNQKITVPGDSVVEHYCLTLLGNQNRSIALADIDEMHLELSIGLSKSGGYNQKQVSKRKKKLFYNDLLS